MPEYKIGDKVTVKSSEPTETVEKIGTIKQIRTVERASGPVDKETVGVPKGREVTVYDVSFEDGSNKPGLEEGCLEPYSDEER